MRRIQFSAAWYSDVGGRQVNEDSAELLRSESLLAAMIADGLGGLGGGDVASYAAVEALQDGFEGLAPLTVDRVDALCREMNRAIRNKQVQGKRMKSTLAAVFYDGITMVFAHVGDSRIYHFRNGRILYQSLDHSVSQLAVMANEIRPEEIRFHVDRNKILRAMGESEDSFHPEIRKASSGPLVGDGILLCSDGFWEHVLEKKMLDAFTKSASAEEWLTRMRQCMKKKHVKNQDNNSAVAILFR